MLLFLRIPFEIVIETPLLILHFFLRPYRSYLVFYLNHFLPPGSNIFVKISCQATEYLRYSFSFEIDKGTRVVGISLSIKTYKKEFNFNHL